MSGFHYAGYTPSKHEPFEATQARRPDFQADRFNCTKQPNPDWQPGQGLSVCGVYTLFGSSHLRRLTNLLSQMEGQIYQATRRSSMAQHSKALKPILDM